MLVATRTKPAGQPLGAAAAGAAPIFVETDGRGDEVRVVPDAASPVRPVRVTEDPLPIEWVVPRRGGARSPKDCDTYASVQSSYDDLASLASERCCDEDRKQQGCSEPLLVGPKAEALQRQPDPSDIDGEQLEDRQ